MRLMTWYHFLNRPAWAIGLETGSSAITEIWVETPGSQPLHLGTFPGPPGRLDGPVGTMDLRGSGQRNRDYLTKEEFGQTNYQVSYTETKKGGFSPLGIITSLIGWKRGKREEFEVTYEMEGVDTEEVEYVELKLENRPAGKYFLNVTVIDMKSGEMAQKKASFILAK